jgi:hypothetical protein
MPTDILPNKVMQVLDYSHLKNEVEFLFPKFIPQFQTTEFESRVEMFLQNELPLHVAHRLRLVSDERLGLIIPAFIKWHESIRYGQSSDYDKTLCAWNLLAVLYTKYATDEI